MPYAASTSMAQVYATAVGGSEVSTSAAAIALLEQQAVGLENACSRLRSALAEAPVADFGRWRGAASAAFHAALYDLHVVTGLALDSLDDAAIQTRRAIASLSSHVG